MTYTLGSLDIGTVQSEDRNKDAQFFQMALPRQDSDKTIIRDLFGVSKTITLTGKKVVTSDGDRQTFASALEAALNGRQITRSYTSDLTGTTIKVLVSAVTLKYNEGAPHVVEYTLVLLEAREVTS